jgi:hypothetical protein
MRAGLDSDGDRAWDYDLQVGTYYTTSQRTREIIMNKFNCAMHDVQQS